MISAQKRERDESLNEIISIDQLTISEFQQAQLLSLERINKQLLTRIELEQLENSPVMSPTRREFDIQMMRKIEIPLLNIKVPEFIKICGEFLVENCGHLNFSNTLLHKLLAIKSSIKTMPLLTVFKNLDSSDTNECFQLFIDFIQEKTIIFNESFNELIRGILLVYKTSKTSEFPILVQRLLRDLIFLLSPNNRHILQFILLTCSRIIQGSTIVANEFIVKLSAVFGPAVCKSEYSSRFFELLLLANDLFSISDSKYQKIKVKTAEFIKSEYTKRKIVKRIMSTPPCRKLESPSRKKQRIN